MNGSYKKVWYYLIIDAPAGGAGFASTIAASTSDELRKALKAFSSDDGAITAAIAQVEETGDAS